MRLVPVCVALGIVLSACGESGSSGSPTSVTRAELAALEAQGVGVATDILANFDQAVDEIQALLQEKPPAAAVTAKVQDVVRRHAETSKVLRTRFLALPAGPARQAANRTLSEKRPPSVARKDQRLGTLVFHYRGVQPGPEIVDAIEKQLVGLLDAAT